MLGQYEVGAGGHGGEHAGTNGYVNVREGGERAACVEESRV